jgi:uncharacterized pyridoxal phosphate-containing UPF0001 family protein
MSLMTNDLEHLNAGSNYRFSATKISKLGAAEYTLATIVEDASGSVIGFAPALEAAIKTTYKAMAKSPRKDNLMLRLTQFNDSVLELHGFKLLGGIQEKDYDNVLKIGGMTALFDAVDESIQATSTYGKSLTAQNFLVNAIVVVITDGADNMSSLTPEKIKQSLEDARKSENLESITLILVGVTNDDNNLDAYLQDFVTRAGITQYVSIGKATPGKIAKLAAFVSQSISSTSAALGSGKASTQVASFTF